jgi:hypothetical protein
MSSWEYLEDQSRPSSPNEGVQAVSVKGSMQLNGSSGSDNKMLKRKNGGLEVPRPKKQIQAQAQDGWVCVSESCNRAKELIANLTPVSMH